MLDDRAVACVVLGERDPFKGLAQQLRQDASLRSSIGAHRRSLPSNSIRSIRDIEKIRAVLHPETLNQWRPHLVFRSHQRIPKSA